MIKLINPNEKKLAIGLMSGTSIDGIDAVLVEISGCGKSLCIEQKHFITYEISQQLRQRILQIAKGDFGGSRELCLFNFYFGTLLAKACCALCESANVSLSQISFVGSHGQTLFHQPEPCQYLDAENCIGTLQLGEASCIAQQLGCPVVSDFRVRDIAAGGQGAPLVPYTEFLLYSNDSETIALQNIGGIGNITLLPAGGSLSDVRAFDTGPGNMIMDALASYATNGKLRYDIGGNIAKNGNVSEPLLSFMLDDQYLFLSPPKTTGREYYGEDYVATLLQQSHLLKLTIADVLATATMFTAKTIAYAINNFCNPKPTRVIVGGGGSLNPVLMQNIQDCLTNCKVQTNEDIGLDSNAKEAVAFAILANETLCGNANNAPSATGARSPVIMGKISI